MDASAPRARSGSGSGAAASAASRWVGGCRRGRRAAGRGGRGVHAGAGEGQRAVLVRRAVARLPPVADQGILAVAAAHQYRGGGRVGGWVAIERASVLAFGNNEWAL